jgi:hypothetical protein
VARNVIEGGQLIYAANLHGIVRVIFDYHAKKSNILPDLFACAEKYSPG